MEITGNSLINEDKQIVWDGLNNPETLRQSIPGCESLEATGENQFKATVVTKIGPIKAKFEGEIELQELHPPESYVIVGSGSAGSMGAAKGKAFVTLSDAPNGTLLQYNIDVESNGKIAQLGSPLIQSTASVLARQFFKTFSQTISTAEIEEPQESTLISGITWWIYVVGGVAALLILILIVYFI